MPLSKSQVAHVRDLLSKNKSPTPALMYLDTELGGVGLQLASQLLNELVDRFNAETTWKYVPPFGKIACGSPVLLTSNQPASDGMFRYGWWRPDRFIAEIKAAHDRFEFPRYYFVRDVLGVVADFCLNDDELQFVQAPYCYGIEFFESTPEKQKSLEETMVAVAPSALAESFCLMGMALESDFATWNAELSGEVSDYIRVLTDAESFLGSQNGQPVFWSVYYDE